MEKLIYFFVSVPVFIFLSVPLLMLLVNTFSQGLKRNTFVLKVWSFLSLTLAFLMSFAVYVICSQGDIAFNEGQYLLTEKMALLFLITQGLSIIALYGIFKFESPKFIIGSVSSIFCSLALINYAAYINKFHSVFIILGVLILLEKTTTIKNKIIFLVGVILSLGGFVFSIKYAGLNLNLTFDEMRLVNLQGDLGTLITSLLGVVVVGLIFLVLNLKVFSKSSSSWHNSFHHSIMCVSALFIVALRLADSGFFEKALVVENFVQWFLILNLFINVFFVWEAKTLLRKFFHIINFNFTMVFLSLLTMVDTYLLSDSSINHLFTTLFFAAGLLYLIFYFSDLKGDDLIPYDLLAMKKISGALATIFIFIILTLAALPPGPVFFNLYGVFQELLSDGYYWVTLWSILGLGLLFSALTPLIYNAQTKDQNNNDVYFLWKQRTVNITYFEYIFLVVLLVFSYVFALINL